MTKSDPQDLSKGDEVSWKWGSQHPKGTVESVEEGGAEVKTKKGSTISKDGSADDPAIVIKTQNDNKAVKSAQGEAAEAEKLAKELGVWDDPFGSGKGKGKPARGSKATSDAKGAKTSKGGKSKAKADDGDDAFSGLAALIQRKNQNRVSQFDDVIAKLEAKAGVKEKRPERRRV
uniref:Hypervirulence associated protein TUDOR domain-containing protein n=1 Tax=Kalmanozyma brasiliensis (strain GHG001) TaxID=1365824 RepID=V5EZT0_KALBG